MPDTPPIEQNDIAPGDQQFDPSQLDDSQLQQFLGLTEPSPDNPDPTPGAEGEAAGDAAADQALETALAGSEPAPEKPAAQPKAPVVETVQAGERKVEEAAPKPSAEVAPVKKPFVVYGKDGQPLEDVPVKEIEITVAGKTKRVDLAGLARMASSGGYNEQLQAEVTAARELKARAEAIEAQARQLAEEREAILRDPDYYLKRVEEYAQAQSPEARAERAEQKLQEVEQRTQQQQAAVYVQQQAETVMLPKLEQILAEYPQVKSEEIMQQFETLIRPYRGPHGGMIPPQFVPAVVDVIDRAIAPWAAQLHDARDEHARAQEAAAKAAAAQAEAEKKSKVATASAVKAKAEVSRTIAPVGRVAARPTPPKAPVKTANEGAERALEDALQHILDNPTS